MAETLLERCLRLARAARALEAGVGAGQAVLAGADDGDGGALQATLAELEAALTVALAAAPVPAAAPTRLPVEQAADQPALIALDLAGYVTGWNEGACALFGYSAAAAIGQHAFFLDAEEADDPGAAELFMEQGGKVVEVLRRNQQGDTVRVAMSVSLIEDEAGEAAGMLVTMAPAALSWRGAASVSAPAPAVALSESDKLRLHARIIEDSEQGVLITDADERIVSCNAAFSRITGYGADELIGRTPELLRSGVQDAEFRARVRATIHGEGSWRGEIVGKRKNGELFPQSVSISVVRDVHGAISHTFSLFSDISVHKDAEARMQRMANYDSLTGLPNRSLFNHLVDQMLSEARRATEYGAVLVVELDRLAAVSDSLGHEVAAQALAEVGRRFRAALRDADILARLDGLKFGVALPFIEKREHAGLVAQKLLATLHAPIDAGSHKIRVGAHIGIAVYLEDSTDTASLMRYAEVAVTKVDMNNGDDERFLFYSEEMDQRAKDRIRLENELRAGLTNGQLELHYQPKVSLRSGRIVGAEALIRWRHPERGMVRPDEFIPLAEETGLILEIGDWVLDEACRQIAAWRAAGIAMPPVAVNLSARQFDRKLPAFVQSVLERHAVQPGQIMLEITESLLVGGAVNVIAIMNELVAMGLALALDDFGTGYSSLAYLKKFPISTLKIDRAFVVGLPDEENDCAIARAIVTMAQQLRQEIVAEGVETVEQMKFLRDLGCDQLQGWLFSPAVPAEAFAAMLKEGKRLEVAR